MKKRYLISAIVFIFVIMFLKLTVNFWVGFLPECFFLKVTGYYCPGCGSTRSVMAMLDGHFIRAFIYNPGIVCLVLIVVIALSEKIFNKKILPRKRSFWIVFIIVLFGYYILRNFTLSLNAL